MNAIISNPVFFKKIIDALCILIERVNIQCDETGLSLQAIDDSQLSLISMYINRNYFESFECSSNTVFGVQLQSIQQILKCVNKTMTLKVRTNDKKTKLKFDIENSGKSISVSTQLIDLETEKFNIPIIEPTASITMPTSEFRKLVSTLNQNGDMVNITVYKNNVFLSTDKNPNFTIKLDSTYSKGTFITSNAKEPFDICFSLRYLSFFTKACPLSEKVTIEINKNFPLIVKFDFPFEVGQLKYFLAPVTNDQQFLMSDYNQKEQESFELFHFNNSMDSEKVNNCEKSIENDDVLINGGVLINNGAVGCAQSENQQTKDSTYDDSTKELIEASFKIIGWGLKWIYNKYLAPKEAEQEKNSQ
ncbi:proliferating cell nuclear antigen [Tritrichomonas musculus]|uniref:DNA sliding clamp PCNA n=1 Tax=Tritrichomonas musculus TaxID=1915356 RepID=A0ABR2L6S3_9EUKA